MDSCRFVTLVLDTTDAEVKEIEGKKKTKGKKKRKEGKDMK